VELGNPKDLEIEVDILSTDAVKVSPGAKVYLDRWGGDHSLLGRVRLVEPSGFTKISALGVEEQRVNVIIDFVDPVEKWSTLGDGFRVDVRIVVAEAENVLKVPTGALFRQAGEWSVFLYQNGKALLRSVEIGKRNDLEAEVLEGLDENTTVIAYPNDKIRDNVSVSPR
jgi:HlyD family secretion protein